MRDGWRSTADLAANSIHDDALDVTLRAVAEVVGDTDVQQQELHTARFYTATVQSRHIHDVRAMSACVPTAEVSVRRGKRRNGPTRA